VRRVVKLVRINEYKRRQSPVGVRITDRGFGKDWRYPITVLTRMIFRMISWGLNVTSTQPSSRREPGRYFRHVAGHFAWPGSVVQVAALLRWPVRQVMLKQLYFTGTESISTIAVVGFVVGLIVITQINNLVGRNELLTIQIMIWTIVRELGPLLTAIVIIGRSSSAFASELSSMQVNGEIKSLRSMNISPISYLVLPRVLAMTLASITLTFIFRWLPSARLDSHNAAYGHCIEQPDFQFFRDH